MRKRKISRDDINAKLTHFLVNIPERHHQDALEYILSQYVAVLADGSGKLQKEHIAGMNEFYKELQNAAL